MKTNSRNQNQYLANWLKYFTSDPAQGHDDPSFNLPPGRRESGLSFEYFLSMGKAKEFPSLQVRYETQAQGNFGSFKVIWGDPGV
jgi:hypothetical protein